MRRVRFILSALLAVLWIAPLHAQTTGTVRGRVVDSTTQQPLSGVMIAVGNRGALTQSDGSYSLAVPAGSYTVRTNMLGYTESTQSITVAAGQAVQADFSLAPQAIALAGIVAIGYGEQRAGNITGAVKQVSSTEFNTGRVVSPEALIQSKVAGVQVVDSNEPGGGVSVRIRGATSVNAGNEPLYVIDGVPVGAGSGGGASAGRNPLNFLQPEEIENITVLKDAASAAIYGANAANGVVLVTTKKGTGRPQIEYVGTVSGSTITRRPDMLNAEEFRAAVTQYAPQNAGVLRNESTNWYDLVTRNAVGQEHNFAVSGSGQSMNYRLSLGYLDQDGIVRGTNVQRLSLGLNYDQRLFDNRLDVRASIKGARNQDQFTPGGVISNAAQMGPTQPVNDPATQTGFYEWPGNLLTSPDNPMAILSYGIDRGTTFRSIGNVQAEYRLPFMDALKGHVNVNYDVTKADRESFTPSFLHSELKAGHVGSLYRRDISQVNAGVDAYLNYASALNVVPGTIDVIGGYSYSQSNGDYPYVVATKLTTNLLNENSVAGAGDVKNFPDIQDSKLISFFGRANYNYNDRYLLSASVRRDGSSRFGTENAWGVFPSVSAAWRISQESFMRNMSGLSDLKLRASWGKTGNQAFANYQQYKTYLTGDANTQVQFGNEWVTTIRPSASDPNIKWEETNSYNIGADFAIMSGRLSGALDFYKKKTNDLIFTVPVAAGTTLSDQLTTNIGSMNNQGVEFSLSAQMLAPQSRSGLHWTADFNVAHNKNELVTINPFAGNTSTQILVGDVAGGVGTKIQVLTPGEAISSFFVYKQKYDDNGKPIQGQYEDLNGDGKINVDDRRPFHHPQPDWILGHSSYFTYDKIDLGFTLRAYLGSYVYNNVASNLGTYAEVGRGAPYNLHASVLETGFTQPQYLSDYYVEDASFLRMDNITLGYSLTYRGQPMRLFATVQNAFTITGYSGVDPTAGLNGIDNNIYPRSRTISGGLSVRF